MQIHSWDNVPKEILNPKIWRKVISGEKVMVAQIFLAQGAIVPTHQHESEQISYVMEGVMEFEMEGRTAVVRKGEVLHIPCNIPHRAVALETTLSLDIFSPIRVDWLTGQDAYLRG